jgi:hypothetical protein
MATKTASFDIDLIQGESMAFFNANHKELKNFIEGKKIKRFEKVKGAQVLFFTDGTYLRFIPHTNVTHTLTSTTYNAEIIVTPWQKNGICSWKKEKKGTLCYQEK